MSRLALAWAIACCRWHRLTAAQFIGIEVHRPGVGRLLSQLLGADTRNLRVYAEDAVEVMEQCLAPNTVDAIHIFFPDPWHKKRHHKRRLIQPKLVHDLATLLRADGYLHLATDWVPYAEHMFEVLDAEPLLVTQRASPALRCRDRITGPHQI